MDSNRSTSPYALAALVAAMGMVGESFGFGSQSRDGMGNRARQHADMMGMRGAGGNRGVKFYKRKCSHSGGKLARMAAKGALGSSGRSSRSRLVLPGSYSGHGNWFPGLLVNCAWLGL